MTPEELRAEIARIGREQAYLIKQAVDMDMSDEIPDGWTLEFAPDNSTTPSENMATVVDQSEPIGNLVTRVHRDGTITIVRPDMTEGEQIWAEMNLPLAQKFTQAIRDILGSWEVEGTEPGYSYDEQDLHSLYDYLDVVDDESGELYAVIGYDSDTFVIGADAGDHYSVEEFDEDQIRQLLAFLDQAIQESYQIQIGSEPQ